MRNEGMERIWNRIQEKGISTGRRKEGEREGQKMFRSRSPRCRVYVSVLFIFIQLVLWMFKQTNKI
jgi:hypothetical protein